MTSMSTDLRTTIARVQEGDSSALQELYSMYADPIRRYCYVRLGDIEAAQDCTQEIFLCVWKGIKKFEYRGDLSFTAWLYTIANNVLVSYVRKRNRASHVPLTPELNLTDTRSLDTARTICDRLMLREAISRLTPEQQHVITLKFFVGLSNLEIAAALNRTEGAVKALQHRAIYRLQSMLASEQPGITPQLSMQEIT